MNEDLTISQPASDNDSPNSGPATDATGLAATAAGNDPQLGLRAALALRHLAEALESLQVGNARSHGWSWQQIADALEVSKQAVHKKYAGGRSGHDGIGDFPWRV